ncbi:copper chaperone PCu(A)C [Streptomyces sp. LP05-1]|uniref:Copper chaperone PCu(A)C n=1 Tax=Streptomyces pyxinae TaxID=2970734 RepID=A0ABT2CJK3_9ACTN|nr:copper chaperone PCu(A)C [Streptomyces sp. LP05-1]MCS0637595.1 copper chaperone PCu(A)C [Streptomyces sp. LP05-1]
MNGTTPAAGTTPTRGAGARLRPAVRALRPALVPLGACLVTLLLLTAYTATGAAGTGPARIAVTRGRVFVPPNSERTSAYFDIGNTGAGADTLELVSSPALGSVMVSRRLVANGAGRMVSAGPLTIPAGGAVRMSPYDVNVMITYPPALEPGDKVPFDLWFRASGRIRVDAVVVPARWG